MESFPASSLSLVIPDGMKIMKENNVVLERKESEQYNPIIIDFRNSCKISKAKLSKPKIDVQLAIKQCPNIAPEIHRGERHSVESGVFSLGYVLTSFSNRCDVRDSTLLAIAGKCTSIPRKRPSLKEINKLLSSIDTSVNQEHANSSI